MFTKLMLVLAIALPAVWTLPRERRQLFEGDVDTAQVVQLLKNKPFVQTQANCAMATDAQAASICDRIGLQIRAKAPTALRTQKCPGNCSVKELKAAVQAYEVVAKLYPDILAKLFEHYKITPEQKLAIEKWKDETLALPDA